MVSYVGEAAISAVNIVDNINNLFIIAFISMCTGGTVVVSQYIGHSDSENARAASRQLYYVVVFMALAVMVPAMIFRCGIIRLLYGAVADDVMKSASVYFLITAASYPFLGIGNACAALFRADGNSKVPMRIALVVNSINIGGNALFIYIFHLGAAGAAAATLISRVIAAFVLTTMLVHRPGIPVSLSGLRRVSLNRAMVRRILNVGIPSGLEGSMFQVGRLSTQRIFTTFGTAAIAGNAIASVINSFSFMPGMAYGMALLTVVGQCIGAGDYEAAKRNTAKIITISWCTIFAISVLIFVFLEPLVSFFRLGPEARHYTVQFLRVHTISMGTFWALSFALPSALRAAGDARYVMVIATASMFSVRVSLAYILTYPFGLGPIGVWIAMGLDFVVRAFFYGKRWLGGKWRENRVI